MFNDTAENATEGILFKHGDKKDDAHSAIWVSGNANNSVPKFSRNVQRLVHKDYRNITDYDIYYSGANLKPSTSSAYDIGSSEYMFKHLYLSGNIYSNVDDGGIIFNQPKKVYIKIKNGANTPSIVSYDPTTENTGAKVAFGTSTLTTDIKGSSITLKGTTTFNSGVTIGSGDIPASLSVFGSGTFDSSITAVTSFVLSKKDGSNYTQFINANANINSFSVGFDNQSKLNFKGESTFTNGPVTIGSTSGNQNLTIYGNALATAFYERSDATKKDVVSNLDVDFDKLKQIPKVNFTWKNDESKQNNIGTIAQELNKVYPELVNGEEGNMTVDYAKLSIIALAAIDKLEDRIKQLEDKLSAYEK